MKDNRSALVDYIAAVQISGGIEKNPGANPLNMAVDRILQTMGQAAAKTIMDDRVGHALRLGSGRRAADWLFCALSLLGVPHQLPCCFERLLLFVVRGFCVAC